MSIVVEKDDNVNFEIYKIITKYPKNLEEKMLLAKNITSICLGNNTISPILCESYEELRTVIGLDIDTAKKVRDSLQLNKTFVDWFRQKTYEKTPCFSITFEILRDTITKIYTEELKVVTLNNLLQSLKRFSIINEAKLLLDFKRHGYTWKRLSGTNKGIVIEKQDQFMERIAYLTKIKRYRQEGKELVYLYLDKLVAAASSMSGLINVNWGGRINTPKFNNGNRLYRWLVNTLIIYLPSNCVIIAPKSARDFTVQPRADFSKKDIAKWLNENDINYDPESTKAEMFYLVKLYERTCPKEICRTEDFLKGHSHDILWWPTNLPNLNYFNKLFNLVDSTELGIVTDNIFDKVKLEEWKNLEKNLIDIENKMYEDDLKVETVIDKLLTLAKYGEINCCDLNDLDTVVSDDEYISSLIQE